MTMDPNVPRNAESYGFRIDPTGTHLSSTLRLEELEILLSEFPATETASAYREAILDLNVLRKRTVASRRKAFDRLRELYGLDPDLLVFRALADLWNADASAQPKIALLCATARDPILRALTPFLLRSPFNEAINRQRLYEETECQFPGKFVPSSRKRLSRNVISTWRKAGMVSRRRDITRTTSTAAPTSLAYALLLGDMCGRRGHRLFNTLWASILDAPTYELKELAIVASRRGWIDYRESGGVVEVSFHHLTKEEGAPSS